MKRPTPIEVLFDQEISAKKLLEAQQKKSAENKIFTAILITGIFIVSFKIAYEIGKKNVFVNLNKDLIGEKNANSGT